MSQAGLVVLETIVVGSFTFVVVYPLFLELLAGSEAGIAPSTDS